MVTVAGLWAEFIRIIVTIFRPWSDYVLDYFYGLVMGKTKPLPPITDPILLMSATELTERIRKKQLTSVEVVKAYVSRSKAVHPYINAAVDQRYENALRDAKAVDEFLASAQKSVEEIARDTPLLGVPFTCKESIGVKGMTQTSGLVRARGRVAKEDSPTAALYRKSGAIPLTVTDVPELCMWWESSNHLYGLTKNPYDNTRTVGGSSGGEGAIITSGGALFGIGNDIAGSIRMPSSFCGIYGHKPSRGVINNFGTYPFCHVKFSDEPDGSKEFVSTGPMCRYVQDVPLLFKILSDSDPKIQWNKQVDFRKVKLYYIEEFPGILHAATPDVKNSIKKAVKHFKDEYSIEATPLRMDELKMAFHVWEQKLLESSPVAFRDLMADKRPGQEDKTINLWLEFFKNLVGCSDHTMPAIFFGMVDKRDKDPFYHECLETFKTIQAKFAKIFNDQEDAILLVPTHPEPPPHYLMTIPMYPNIAYTCIFNILGFPSSQIPAGLSRGAPIGIQAISGQFKDHLTVATAVELDKVFGGWISPCSVDV
ncbi:hypothetical protein JTE90_009578 [Oedothorax gibbosus]|uniref:Amidase domain-containing protein n=1 Tax=Oedothorax gibbosus TaxID=931172 RepID=A0AAV6VIR0_9ARAC|nr:hypothetical protein JTE90_009578 [Oedothorax gibbosus]